MPRINTVKKARKDQGACSKCGKQIVVGSPYQWIAFRHGGRRVICDGCTFRASDLTQSKMSGVYAAQESAVESIGSWDGEDVEELRDILQACAEAIREVAQEYQDSADAIHDSFCESATADECEEKAQELESWADMIEGTEFDEFDEDEHRSKLTEEFEGLEPDYACEACNGVGHDVAGAGCQACGGTGNTIAAEIEDRLEKMKADWVQEQCDEASSVLEDCPC